MKNRMKSMAVILPLLAIVAMMFSVPAARADDGMSFVDFVNSSINTETNRIELTDAQIEGYVQTHKERIYEERPEYAGHAEEFTQDMESLVASTNERLAQGDVVITQDGRIVPKSPVRQRRAAQFKLEWFWWGTRRTFYTDQEARKFADDMDRAADISDIAGISSLLFPGMAIPTKLSAKYATAVAKSMRWAADQPGNGVVLDTKFWLAYTAEPRK